jgi:hypothetical protein
MWSVPQTDFEWVYTLITRTDTYQSSGYSVGADTGGGFCFSKQQSSSQLANQVAALTVHDSIDSNEFIVHHLVSEGGSIQSNGVNGLKPDTIEARSVAEYQQSSSFSVSGNYKNYLTPDTQVNHLLPTNCQSRQITTTDVYVNQQDYRAHKDTVIYGAQGTAVTAHQAVGNIHTTSLDGTVVDKDTSHQYHVAIPHIDAPTRQQFKDNKDFLVDKLKPAPAPVATNPTPSQVSGTEDKVPTAFEKPKPATGNSKENGPQEGSSNLEPWQASVVAGFDAGLGIEGKASSLSSDQGDPLIQEATFIYGHSQTASASYDAPKTKASNQGQTEDSLAYVYSAPRSFDEQARDYFQEQMVGFYGDYQKDSRRKEDKLDLTVPEYSTKNRATHYQNTVSQPKDWRSSLARWERAALDNFDYAMQLPEAKPSSTIGNPSSSFERDSSNPNRPTPIPIYQLPEFRREPIRNHPITPKSDPSKVKINPKAVDAFMDLATKAGQGIDHLVDNILEIQAGVQRGAVAGFTLNPMDTSAMNGLEKTGYRIGEAAGVVGSLMIGEAVGFAKVTQKYSAHFFNSFKAFDTKNTRLISNIRRVSSNFINKEFINEPAIAAGWHPPYPPNLSLRKIITAQELTFYRVHVKPNDVTGKFLAREKEIAPYLNDPEALRIHLGLPYTPIYITEVNVPAGTELLVGRIGAQPSFGLIGKSGFQYQTVGYLPKSSFVNTHLIIRAMDLEARVNLNVNY